MSQAEITDKDIKDAIASAPPELKQLLNAEYVQVQIRPALKSVQGQRDRQDSQQS